MSRPLNVDNRSRGFIFKPTIPKVISTNETLEPEAPPPGGKYGHFEGNIIVFRNADGQLITDTPDKISDIDAQIQKLQMQKAVELNNLKSKVSPQQGERATLSDEQERAMDVPIGHGTLNVIDTLTPVDDEDDEESVPIHVKPIGQ